MFHRSFLNNCIHVLTHQRGLSQRDALALMPQTFCPPQIKENKGIGPEVARIIQDESLTKQMQMLQHIPCVNVVTAAILLQQHYNIAGISNRWEVVRVRGRGVGGGGVRPSFV